MKTIVAVLLALVLAVGGYLAFDSHQRKQRTIDAEEANADPGRYLVKQWAERADLRCDDFVDVHTSSASDGDPVPTTFTCTTPSGRWHIAARDCTTAELALEPGDAGTGDGYPAAVGTLYKPDAAVCWSVQAP